MTTPGEYHQRDRSAHPPAFAPGYRTSVARSSRCSMISLQNSVSEITGPVFGPNELDPGDNDLLTNFAKPGEGPIGDPFIPLFIPLCPILQTIPDPAAVAQLTARLDMNAMIPLDTVAYRFDIVLRGRRSTLFESRLEGNGPMPQALDYLTETASQPAGPYVHIDPAPGAVGLDIYRHELGWDIAGPNAAGERIRVEGRVVDGMGAPIKDALIEVWQANAEGRYAHPEGGGPVEEGFRGWGRVITDFTTGEWGFDTVKPGATRGRNVGPQAPHLNLWIVARGINLGLNTRMYFSDEAAANAADPVLNLIEWENRRATLIAARSDRDGAPVYRFDIRLQGEGETVFFDV